MRTNASQKTKIGIFTLVGIIVLVLGVFLIGKKKNMFGDTYEIYGTFRNVGGLQIGNNIRFAGINVGTVENIEILNDTTIKVDMRLQSKVKPFLKADALATIGSDGLMGDKLVTISPGVNNVKLLGRGEKILTTDPVEMDKIVMKLTQVANNAATITNALADIATKVQHGEGSLGRLLYKDDLAVGLESTVSSANQTMQAIKKGSEGFGENMEALKHNFLLRGYYRRKAKAALKKQEKIEQQATKDVKKSEEATKEDKKQDAREEKKQQAEDKKQDIKEDKKAAQDTTGKK